jgi:predicted nucleic acid-binding protein
MFSPDEEDKKLKSIETVRALGNSMVLSTQVLQEAYSVCTRKLRIEQREAKDIILALMEAEVVSNTPELLENAIDLSIVTGFSIWDSLIVQAAIQSRCTRILTEDLQHGQTIKGVRIENPFV